MGPDGKSGPSSQDAGGGGMTGAIRRDIVPRYARAPKSVIHLKVSQEITRQGKPGRVGPGAARNISETARAIHAARFSSSLLSCLRCKRCR